MCLIDAIPKILNDGPNKMLVAIPSHLEIRKVVFSFEGNKAPGPDGFPMFFFQKLWDIVAKDVCNVVKEFFDARRILKEINSTFIVLILKVPGVDSLDAFRLIGLCNSFYKIISKVLTTRLLTVLPSIISSQQKGFVPGR